MTRTPEWRRDVNEMGEIPVLEVDGERLHPDRADPAASSRSNTAGSAARPSREIRSAALAVLGQPQAHRLHGNLSVLPGIHAVAGPACAEAFPQAPRRLPGILEHICRTNAFAIGEKPTVADFSMMAYLSYPSDETGYDLAVSHPAVDRLARAHRALPGWQSAYDLLPGKRLTHYARISSDRLRSAVVEPSPRRRRQGR